MWLEDTKPDAVESSKLELLLTKFVQPSRPTPVKFGASAAASGETSGKPETPATESAEEPQPEPEKQKFRAINEPQDLMKFNVRLRDKHLAVRMHDPTLIGKGLLNMDSELLREGPLEKLQELLVDKASGALIPGIQRLKDELKVNPNVELDRNELLLKSVANLPNLAARLEACLFKAKFQTFMRDYDNDMAKYEMAMGNIFISGVFRKVLLIVRQIRNFTNYDPKKSDVYGVKLSSLSKLDTMKTTETPPRTLLHVLCELLTTEEKQQLVEMLSPVCEVARDEKWPNFEAMRRSALTQLTELKKKAEVGGLKQGDRFTEVWDEWVLVVRPQLDSEGLSSRIRLLKELIDDVCGSFGEQESTLDLAFKSVAAFVVAIQAIMKTESTDKPGGGAPSEGDKKGEGDKKADGEKKEEKKKPTWKFEVLLEGATNPMAASIRPKFVPLRTIRDNWLYVRKEFLDIRTPEQVRMPFNGAQACAAALKSLYDIDHPRWNKVKNRIEVGIVKATADCGNTSVSMGFASRFFRDPKNADIDLVGFLNGGTRGLKLQFYGRQRSDKRVVVLAEVKNHFLKFSKVAMANYAPKDPTDQKTVEGIMADLESEMKLAPWENQENKKKLGDKLGVDVSNLTIPVFAFVTGTIRNHWEQSSKEIQGEMDSHMTSLLKGYARPWGACASGSESSSYFIPQAREGECEFEACTTLYQQIGKFAEPESGKATQPTCVASFGMGAGSCQWMTRRPGANSGLHAVLLRQGMNQAGLVHLMASKIINTYEDPETSFMFDDFLTVIELQNRPVIALKAGCLLILDEYDKDKVHIENLTKQWAHDLEIRVFYQTSEDSNRRVASTLSLDKSWLGKTAQEIEDSRSALYSRICADAGKAFESQQFFHFECRGRDGYTRVLENDSTVIVSGGDAVWFTDALESKSKWSVYSALAKEDDWEGVEGNVIMHTVHFFFSENDLVHCVTVVARGTDGLKSDFATNFK